MIVRLASVHGPSVPEYGSCGQRRRVHQPGRVSIQSNPTTARSLALAGYPLALLLIAVPLLDVVPKVLPMQWGNADWRYGAVGFLFGSIVTPIIGLAIAGSAAVVARQAGVLTLVSVLALVLAGVLVAGGVMFLVDFGAVAPNLSERVSPAFRAATTKTAVIALLAAAASAWLGLAGLRAVRSARSRGPEDKSAGLVVGH